jgi:acyl transferase domain-containing protein
VQTACSTSLVAVHLACQSLRAGDADIALAGGACVALPQHAGYAYEPKGILSPTGTCRPFDVDANGTVPGNGVALVALKRAEDALRDADTIYALIKGSAINNDGGGKAGYSAPGVAGQVDVLSRAYRNACVEPAGIGYLEAHGTATEIGDAIELAALAEVFGGHPGVCVIGSAKANVGHLDAAAGVAGLIKAALALHFRQIPPLAGLKTPRAELVDGSTPFRAYDVAQEFKPGQAGVRRAAVSAFGLGGTNVHVVLEEAPQETAQGDGPGGGQDGRQDGPAVLVLSARTAESLGGAARRLAEHLRRQPDLRVKDVAATLQSRRRPFAHRLAVAVGSVAEGATQVLNTSGREALRRPSLVFLFPGQGTEFAGMTADLYRRYPSLRQDIDRGAELVRPLLGLDLRDVLVGDDPAGRIHRTDVTQPALLLHEYALGRLLLRWGVRPSAAIGHSVGEYAAAALAGEAALGDVLRLVTHRGALMQDTPEGGMVAVFADEPTVRRHLRWPEVQGGIEVAAVNAPRIVVVAGPPGHIDILCGRLRDEEIAFRRLPAQRAFHSRLMSRAAADLGRRAAEIPWYDRTFDIIGSLSGELLPAGAHRPAHYWTEQLLNPVRFHAAIETARCLPNPVFVEVGPGTALTGTTSMSDDTPAFALQPHRKAGVSAQDLLAGIGELWASGVSVDWTAIRGEERTTRLTLPTYSFARTRIWLDPPAPQERAAQPAPGPPGRLAGEATSREILPQVMELWTSMLGIPEIHPDSDFFALGGESLSFFRMLARARRLFAVEIDATALLATPTPKTLAAQLAHSATADGGADG